MNGHSKQDAGSEDVRERELLRIAKAIDERLRIDWDSEAAQSPDSGRELQGLREVERIARAQDRVQDTSVSPEDELIGSTLSHYRVVERIGRGGMAVVYRARDERLRRDVALKVLRADRLRDEIAERALLHEARLACSINHPNVAAIHDVGEVGGHIFFAMECVEGKTLSEIIRGHPLSPRTALDYGIQIAAALEAAHDAGIVHRDLKSLNIRVTPSGVVKVLDFGLSIRSGAGLPGGESEVLGSYTVAGTIAYMAPEAFRGERQDARGDIWALGVTLYEAFSGHLPFRAQTKSDLERAILHDDPAPLPAHIPAPLRRVLERCLRKEPSRRYQRAGEVRAALEAIRDAALPRRPWLVGTWVAGVAAVAVAAYILSQVGPCAPKEPGLLAVFPIRNMSGAPEQQFLADGLTDQLISTFGQLSPIPVMGRPSSEAIAQRKEPLSQMARRFNIAFVLEGSCLRERDRVHVSARLVDAMKDQSLLAESYDRPVAEIVTLDREIARAVAARIKAHLSRSDQQHLAASPAVDLAAYRAYVQGRSLAAEREYGRALEFFTEAVHRDSTFAAAYAGLADCYTEMLYYGQIAPLDGMARAERAAKRALELGARQASPHLALAFLYGIQWDWAHTDQELLQALRDEPGSAEAWYRRSIYLGVLGQTKEHVGAMERAVHLDPLSIRFAVELGLAYMNARQIDEAEAQFHRVMERDSGPEARRARAYAARCLTLRGHALEAVAMLQASGRPAETFEQEELAYALARSGRTEEARRLIASLSSPDSRGPASPLAVAAAQLGLGDREAAFATLSHAVAQREPRIVWIQVDQRFDSIRKDPRYTSLLESMGLSFASHPSAALRS